MIENELKYVLRFGVQDDNRLKSFQKHIEISQAYVGQFRIRKSVVQAWDRFAEFQMALKVRTENGRNIEIEPSISEDEFNYLWNDCKERLFKTRYEMKNDLQTTAVDIFHKDGEVYFAMAEIEFEDHLEFPTTIPSIISDYLIFAVPRSDDRFTSKKLCSIDYGSTLMATLIHT